MKQFIKRVIAKRFFFGMLFLAVIQCLLFPKMDIKAQSGLSENNDSGIIQLESRRELFVDLFSD